MNSLSDRLQAMGARLRALVPAECPEPPRQPYGTVCVVMSYQVITPALRAEIDQLATELSRLALEAALNFAPAPIPPGLKAILTTETENA